MKRKYKFVKVIKLNEYEVYGETIKDLKIFVSIKTGCVFLLPLFFAVSIQKNRYTYPTRKTANSSRRYEVSFISESTLKNYLSCIHLFLETLEEYANNADPDRECVPSANNPHWVTASYVSKYINLYLPSYFSSRHTLVLHKTAVQIFMNWFEHHGLKEPLVVNLSGKSFEKLDGNGRTKDSVIQYISRDFRNEMLRRCKKFRDRIILRCGFELGLRSSENLGLVLKDQIINGKKKHGLLSLFLKLENGEVSASVDYWINGVYCKNSRSRLLVIHRSLLDAMRQYYHGERQQFLDRKIADSNHLLINYGNSSRIEISEKLPSDKFREIKEQIVNMDKGLTYHDLRHTFGTELYARLVNNRVDSSKALLAVQDALGHMSWRSTTLYIHLFEQMTHIESDE